MGVSLELKRASCGGHYEREECEDGGVVISLSVPWNAWRGARFNMHANLAPVIPIMNALPTVKSKNNEPRP